MRRGVLYYLENPSSLEHQIINRRRQDKTVDRTKKVLIMLLAIGALATLGVGTFASFNATTTNGSNTFQTGTIFLKNTAAGGAGTGTACFSYGSIASGTFSNGNSNSCDVIVNSSNAANQKPLSGSSASSAVIKLENTGTLNGKLTLQFSCSQTAHATIYGSGSICNYIAVTVQPCATYTSGGSCATNAAYCVYPASTTAACSSPALTGDPNTVVPTGSLADMALTGAGKFGTTSPVNDNTGTQITLQAASANNMAYQVSWQFIDNGTAGHENNAQGQTAGFNFTWSIA